VALAWVAIEADRCMAPKRRRIPTPEDIAAGQQLRLWRESRHLTQVDLAVVLGMEGSTYGRRETGEIRVRGPELLTLARFYGCAPADLLPGAPPPDAQPPRDALLLARELYEALVLQRAAPDDPRWDAVRRRAAQLPAAMQDKLLVGVVRRLERLERAGDSSPEQ
jgi:transcriptional regulator with XRE-family HTH domain